MAYAIRSAHAAALLALTAAFAPLAATAGTTVTRDHRTAPVVHDHRTAPVVRDHRTTPEVRDHRTPPPANEVVTVRPRLDCRAGSAQLWKLGYRSISAYDCTGEEYHYTAMDGTTLYGATMRARTGALEVRLIGIVSN